MNRIVSSIYISVSLLLFFLLILAKEVLQLMNSLLWIFPWAALVIGGCYLYADLDTIQKKKAEDKK